MAVQARQLYSVPTLSVAAAVPSLNPDITLVPLLRSVILCMNFCLHNAASANV